MIRWSVLVICVVWLHSSWVSLGWLEFIHSDMIVLLLYGISWQLIENGRFLAYQERLSLYVHHSFSTNTVAYYGIHLRKGSTGDASSGFHESVTIESIAPFVAVWNWICAFQWLYCTKPWSLLWLEWIGVMLCYDKQRGLLIQYWCHLDDSERGIVLKQLMCCTVVEQLYDYQDLEWITSSNSYYSFENVSFHPFVIGNHFGFRVMHFGCLWLLSGGLSHEVWKWLQWI